MTWTRGGNLLPGFKGVSIQARYLIVSSMLIFFAVGFFSVALSLYLFAAGMSAALIGIIITAQSLFGVVLATPLAMVSDAKGRKIFIWLGFLIESVACLIFFSTVNVVAIFIAATLFGIVNGLISSPFIALLTENAKGQAERNATFSLYYFATQITFSMGALAAGVPALFAKYFGLSMIDSFKPPFLADALVSLVAGLLVIAKVTEAARPVKESGDMFKGMFRLPRKSIRVVLKFSVVGLLGFGAGLLIPLFPLWFQLRYGLGLSTISSLFGGVAFILAFVYLFTPAIAKKYGGLVTIVATQLIGTLFLVMLPLMPTYVLAGGVMAARNITMNMSGPVQTSFQMSRIYPEERAAADSLIYSFDAVPRAIAPAVAGYLFSAGYLLLPFFITAAFYATSAVLFYSFFRGSKPID